MTEERRHARMVNERRRAPDVLDAQRRAAEIDQLIMMRAQPAFMVSPRQPRRDRGARHHRSYRAPARAKKQRDDRGWLAIDDISEPRWKVGAKHGVILEHQVVIAEHGGPRTPSHRPAAPSVRDAQVTGTVNVKHNAGMWQLLQCRRNKRRTIGASRRVDDCRRYHTSSTVKELPVPVAWSVCGAAMADVST